VNLQVEGSFPRDGEALPRIFDLAETFLARAGLSGTHRFLVDFTLEELFTNTVKYNASGGGEIGIQLRLEEGELRISVIDSDADPFDLRVDAPRVDPDLPLAERRPGGLGIHLMKELADRIAYDYSGRVATIHLYKKLE